jgi:hypothetical protein
MSITDIGKANNHTGSSSIDVSKLEMTHATVLCVRVQYVRSDLYTESYLKYGIWIHYGPQKNRWIIIYS